MWAMKIKEVDWSGVSKPNVVFAPMVVFLCVKQNATVPKIQQENVLVTVRNGVAIILVDLLMTQRRLNGTMVVRQKANQQILVLMLAV